MLYVVTFFCFLIFFFKQKTAYEMRISDWSSDVCSSDLAATGKVEKLKASPDEFAGNIGNVTPLPGGALLYSRNSALAPTDLFVRDAKGKVGQLTEIGRASCRERVCQYV